MEKYNEHTIRFYWKQLGLASDPELVLKKMTDKKDERLLKLIEFTREVMISEANHSKKP